MLHRFNRRFFIPGSYATCDQSDRGDYSRRDFLMVLFALGVSPVLPDGLFSRQAASGLLSKSETLKKFRVWVFSDAHVGRDKKYGPRDSLADAIHQSESAAGFDWDIALNLGDISGEVGLPKDSEGEEIVRQFGTLVKHRREQVYDLSGNHDRSGLDEPQAWWWRKWIDPTGEHTEFSHVDRAKRPFPIEGTWERYSFRAGNLLFLMMSDINEPTQKVGRGTLGGNPGGRKWSRRIPRRSSSVPIITCSKTPQLLQASGKACGETKKANGSSSITDIGHRERRRARRIFTGWTASRIQERSRTFCRHHLAA